jgi:hypothetical protein
VVAILTGENRAIPDGLSTVEVVALVVTAVVALAGLMFLPRIWRGGLLGTAAPTSRPREMCGCGARQQCAWPLAISGFKLVGELA